MNLEAAVQQDMPKLEGDLISRPKPERYLCNSDVYGLEWAIPHAGAEAPFLRVSEALPHSKWPQGTNLAFVSYAADPDAQTVIALGAVDNLGKGAAGQAVQNMNLMLGCPEVLGLDLVPMTP